MDVRAENRGRPHQKVRFPAAPVVGRNFLTPGRPGVRVRNVCGKSGSKVYVYAVFSSLKRTLSAKNSLINLVRHCLLIWVSKALLPGNLTFYRTITGEIGKAVLSCGLPHSLRRQRLTKLIS